MVMEYVSGGELFDYILKHGKVSHRSCELSVVSYFLSFTWRPVVSWEVSFTQAHSIIPERCTETLLAQLYSFS